MGDFPFRLGRVRISDRAISDDEARAAHNAIQSGELNLDADMTDAEFFAAVERYYLAQRYDRWIDLVGAEVREARRG